MQVDLQINYLWQLQHKPISSSSFPTGDDTTCSAVSGIELDSTTEDDHHTELSVLASATETDLKGPALGPDLFVEAILRAYTSFLEREIINGPIGERIRQRGSMTPGTSRAVPPGKVLIAAALPPLVEDEILPRIPEKYVERLQEDHEKSMTAFRRASDSGSRTPRSRSSPVPRPAAKLDDTEVGLSKISITDEPASPESSLTNLSRTSSIFDNTPLESSWASVPSVVTSSSLHPVAMANKVAISTLLTYDPPLCTLAVRRKMTDNYNAGLAAYCSKYPDIFGFVDISPAMHPIERATWACPVDRTNIHPLWEATLPLWLSAIAEHGVPTEGYSISEAAEETFKAYELDKKSRTEDRDGVWREEPVKIRDE